MTRAEAIACLVAASENPEIIVGSAVLSTVLDAIAVVYATNPPPRGLERYAAMQAPAAVWSSIHAHAEHRARLSRAG